MLHKHDYLIDGFDTAVAAIIAGIDRDVERGEDVLMMGFGAVMMSSFFAPIAPPSVLLPLIALAFALSSGFARKNYHSMERKLSESMQQLAGHEKSMLRPVAAVFAEYPMEPLAESYNPMKNMRRTVKSALGGLLINPLWMPIFYIMGMQINEEKNLIQLNRAIIGVRQKITPPPGE